MTSLSADYRPSRCCFQTFQRPIPLAKIAALEEVVKQQAANIAVLEC